MSKLAGLGVFLALAAVFLAASFQFVADHRWYWHAATAVSIVVVLAAASGGLLMGCNLGQRRPRRLWPLVIGSIVLVAWFGSSVMAVSSASVGMNYFYGSDVPINWDSYAGDYLVGWFNIRFLQLATLLGLLGGFLLGWGLGKPEK